MIEEGCKTPRNRRIPTTLVCPPTPKKKSQNGRKQEPPKNGYFQPPDLEVLFSLPQRRRGVWA
ncbi:hypothetical protein GIB67_034027 [Kingdonia uniflora]|uniref:Uncharacterized protein n=1 Tax=Kingdonia uniflora TaxID=39325 RepID=A0A7J7M6D2_9MAGN|nr:hypothetical protein GIB67_034027 [Kingdonia uniflora]